MTQPDPASATPSRAGADLFLISLLLLFAELACIRWFPAHVLYLTFFTNVVLLACFLGMSVGCLAAGHRRDYLAWTPLLLALALGAANGVEYLREHLERLVDVGHQESPQVVFFGTEYHTEDLAGFVIPIEVLGGVFFLLLALAFIGPGQEMGRAFNRLPNRVWAYSVNILGSIVGIVLFSLCAWMELTPFWWFLLIAVGLGYFLIPRYPAVRFPAHLVGLALSLAAVVALAVLPSLRVGPGRQQFWSPYYRIDYDLRQRAIHVNLIGHQAMVPIAHPWPAYALPYLLHRDAGGEPFEDVLIIGAGSGNDVSRALQWGARHVDAVEIDPVIQRLGARDHPDQPYRDPRVVVLEKINARFLSRAEVPEAVPICTIDVSFISLTLILPRAFELLSPEGVIIALVKPQFEL